MMFQSLCLGLLPFLDAIGGLVANLIHSSVAFDIPRSYGGHQYIHGLSNDDDDEEANKPIHVVEDDDDDSDALDWQLIWTLDLLDTSHVHVDLVFPCACHAASSSAPSRSFQRRPHTKQRKGVSGSSGSCAYDSSSLWRVVVAKHEKHLTYAVVVATLQLFLHLTRANATTLFLPMLAHATGGCGRKAARMGDAVLVLANTCGVLGSALAARQLGREAMCAISGVLIVLCQVAVPAMMAAGLSCGARLTGGHAAGMFALACAASCGLSWAWGALFWAVPGEGIRSVGQAAAAALGFGLGFAQMQCFLLTLRQLKHAAFAYYVVWIWS